MKAILNFLLVLSLYSSKLMIIQSKICNLNNGCILKAIYEKDIDRTVFNRTLIECKSVNSEEKNISEFIASFDKCRLEKRNYIRLDLNRFGNKNNLIEYSQYIYGISKQVELHSVYILNSNGFNVDQALELYNDDSNIETININKFRFQFFHRNKPIQECIDFEALVNFSSRTYFLQIDTEVIRINFEKTVYKTPICELFFNNINTLMLTFGDLVDSYFKTNKVKILNSSSLSLINAKITNLDLETYSGIHLDWTILNPKVFNRTLVLHLMFGLKSIQTDLFKPFINLRHIQLPFDSFSSLVKSQGIEWIRNINSGLNVNMSDLDDTNRNLNRIKRIILFRKRGFYIDKKNYFTHILDEDICLYREFPFNQLILVKIDGALYSSTDRYSCALKWLVQYQDIRYNLTIRLKLTECEIEKRFSLCNKSDFTVKSDQFEKIVDFIVISEFLLIIFSSIISVYAVAINIIVIFVILKKDDKKELVAKQYTYMAIHSFSNIFICVFELLSMINKCQEPFGIFCSSIRELIAIQYYKIVFGEYFNSFFRLMSNFAYIGFAFNRLSLVGKDHNKLTRFVSDIDVKYYIFIVFIPSAGLSVVKPFRFEINAYTSINQFPMLFNFEHEWQSNLKLIVLMVFNGIYDFVNYILFVILNLVIDLILVKKLSQIMREKEEKFKDQSEQQRAKLKAENETKARNVRFMILLSLITNFVLKIPITITTFNDLRLMIRNSHEENFFSEYWFTFPYSMRYFCHLDKICGVFQSFGNCLFLLSLTISFFFLKKYDNNFKTVYKRVKK